jgi:hypothetical protein
VDGEDRAAACGVDLVEVDAHDRILELDDLRPPICSKLVETIAEFGGVELARPERCAGEQAQARANAPERPPAQRTGSVVASHLDRKVEGASQPRIDRRFAGALEREEADTMASG